MRFFRPVIIFLVLALCSCKGGDKDWHEPQSEADLSGLSVTSVSGTLYDIELSKRPDIKKVLFKSTADCLEALDRGMVDVYVDDDDTFTEPELKRQKLKIAFRGGMELPTAFAFQKGSELRDQFNLFLDSLNRDGSVERIRKFWANPEGVPFETIPEIETYTEGEFLRIGTASMREPNSYVANGVWVGFEVELVKRFAASLKRPVIITHFDVPSLIFGLQTGNLDIMMGSITVTEERKRNIDFSEPYEIKHPAFYVIDRESETHHMAFFSRIGDSFYQNLFLDKRWSYIIRGLQKTLDLTMLSVLFGSLLGILLCAMSRSRKKWMKDFVSVYALLMHGLPMLVLLLFMFYVVFSGSSINALFVAVVAFSLNFTSSASGIFSSSIDAIPKGQTEAGLALGFTKIGTFTNIVLPQAIQKGLSSFKGACIGLLKNTSIVGYIGVLDLTKASDLIRSRTFDAFVPLLLISVVYLILAWAIGKILDLALKKS
ncbi:MAG: ABC transporter permease subunit [Bacteroidales bacterium]|nr:ABC transporter permease subunit [Bacteroidales bacterium]